MFIVLFCIVAITLWLLNKFVLPFNNQPLSDNPAVMNPVLPVKKETPAYKLALPTLTKSSPTLFLDIDGVCHKNFDESLSHLPILEAFLEEHKGVQIVISSTWRTTCEKEFLAGVWVKRSGLLLLGSLLFLELANKKFCRLWKVILLSISYAWTMTEPSFLEEYLSFLPIALVQ